MLRKFILVTVGLLIAAGPAMAMENLGFWDYDTPGSTHQEWNFNSKDDLYELQDGDLLPTGQAYNSNDTLPASFIISGNPVTGHVPLKYMVQADNTNNTLGNYAPTALIGGVKDKCEFFLEETEYEGRSGVMHGDPVTIELYIPNTKSTVGHKTVWMEIIASYTSAGIPTISPYGSPGNDSFAISPQSGLQSIEDLDENWKRLLYKWEITPNPQDEVIANISFLGTGGHIDSIAVDTLCKVPAPGAFLLGGIGVALVGYFRRIHY